jgi:hypothetical protein
MNTGMGHGRASWAVACVWLQRLTRFLSSEWVLVGPEVLSEARDSQGSYRGPESVERRGPQWMEDGTELIVAHRDTAKPGLRQPCSLTQHVTLQKSVTFPAAETTAMDTAAA